MDISPGFTQAVLAPNGQLWAIGPAIGGGLNFQATSDWRFRLGLEWRRVWDDTVSNSVVKWPDPDLKASRAWTTTTISLKAQRRIGFLEEFAPYLGFGIAWTDWSVKSYPAYKDLAVTDDRGDQTEFAATEFTLLGAVGIEPNIYKETRLRIEGGIDLLTGIGTDFSEAVNDERSHAQLVFRVGLVIPFPRSQPRAEPMRPTPPLIPPTAETPMSPDTAAVMPEPDTSEVVSEWEETQGPPSSYFSDVEKALTQEDTIAAEAEAMEPESDTAVVSDTASIDLPSVEVAAGDTSVVREDTVAAPPMIDSVAGPERSEVSTTILWDSDQDGVADSIDNCPNTPPGALVNIYGCPLDEDRDGVYDGIDRCPNTPAVARMVVDSVGCPVDSDSDGVADYLDYCPDTPPGVPVTELGCPPDGDGDGVPNITDRCPDTPKGLEVDETGCLVMTQLKRRLILHVSYLPGTTDPDRLSKRILDDLAIRLKSAQTLYAVVEGFTDNIGVDSANLEVSQKRADKVKEYLVSKGIEPERIEAYGRGETEFIADNSTAAGRQKNRRIEISFHRIE